MHRVDLNADVGEVDEAVDAALIPLITSANIACGGHAGDELSMRRTVRLAVRHGVHVAAHPGYADRAHFGRVPKALSPEAIIDLIRTQVRSLERIAQDEGARLHHVKPHGALYNQAEEDLGLAAAIVAAVAAHSPALALVGRAGSAMQAAADAAGIAFAPEAFADRRYRRDGSLKPRSEPRAVLESANDVIAQVGHLCTDGEVIADDGTAVPVAFETLCLHSDTAHSATLAARIREHLRDLGVSVQPL